MPKPSSPERLPLLQTARHYPCPHIEVMLGRPTADLSLCSAVYCQIFDSIFRMCPFLTADRADTDAPFTVDVPMSRVKFNANTEYQYLQNFKVLQSTPPSAACVDLNVTAN